MEKQLFEGKTVPWSQFEEYLELFKNLIKPFLALKKIDGLEIHLIEASLPKHLFKLHDKITKILQDNSIL